MPLFGFAAKRPAQGRPKGPNGPPCRFSGPWRIAMLDILQRSRGTSVHDHPSREALMKLGYLFTAASVAVMLSAQPGLAQTKTGVDKLYILNCGEGVGPDQARWSPGVNVGRSE